MPQTSQSGRVVTLVTVSQGRVFTANPGDTSWHEPTNTTGDSPALNFTGIVRSAANSQKLYFADGINWVRYDPRNDRVERWSPSAGALPVDSGNNTPRLICTWRGRTVLSGLLLDPQNWFMSRVNDATDFDYFPLDPDPASAIAGNNAPQGLMGDLVTALVPYSDDVLLMGGDHTIYMFHGDPQAGGQIDLVSDSIGMAWGMPWARDPYGTVYFFSNKAAVYSYRPGEKPLRISQAFDNLIQDTDTGSNIVRMGWDDRFQGVHLFITQASAPAPTTHYFFEQRTGAWWQESFANTNHNPVCCCQFDGNEPGDRALLIGSWDGYVRTFDPDAATDDGTTISSSVVIGPLLTKDLDEITVKELQAVLGANSGSVTYEVYAGATAEAALASTAIATGTWSASRNLTNLVRRSAHAIYIRIRSTNRWAMEQVRANVATRGKVRRRGA